LHEIDHINGELFIEKLSEEEKLKFIKNYESAGKVGRSVRRVYEK